MRACKFKIMFAVFLIFNFSFLIPKEAKASFEMHPASVLLLGRGGWSVADEACASMENCAASSKKLNWEAGGANFYGISSLNEYFFSLNVPLKTGGFNFIHSMLKFSSVYRENVYSFSFNRRLTKKINAGMRFNVFQLDVEKFEQGLASRRSYSDYALGALYREKYFNLGVSFLSLNSKDVTFKKVSERTPASVRYGLMLKPVKGTTIGVDCASGETPMAGIEIETAGALRSAVGIRKNVFTMGFSLRLPVMWVNFSMMVNNEIGNTYFISISRK